MSFNTFKTILGFLQSLLRKYTPYDSRAYALTDIYNYLKISDRISKSGQPTEKQFGLIKADGFETVINLAPHHAENSLENEQSVLDHLNIQYIHIPVDFKAPNDLDFEQFKSVMTQLSGKKVWVHCAANMRVSAFIYRYRCTVLNEAPDIAKDTLSKIWEPSGVWRKFIS